MTDPLPCQLIEDYHDGLLDDQSVELFQDHLATCSECQVELATLQKLEADVAAAWQRVELPDDQLELSDRTAPSFSAATSLWRVAAAIVVLASIAALIWQGMDRQPVVELPESRGAAQESHETEPVDHREPAKPVAIVKSRPMFAVATFPDNAFAEVVDSTPELTVYSVIPQNTFSRSSEEP